MSIRINRQLSIIVNAIQIAREIAGSDDDVALYLSENNGLSRFHIGEVETILNRLEKDEKVIKIIHKYGDTMSSHLGNDLRLRYEKFEYFLIELLGNFDEWLKDKKISPDLQLDEAKLTVHKDGTIKYVSSSGKTHEAKFRTKTNAFLLLRLLVSKPKEIFSITDLTNKLKDLWHANDEIDDRKIRDAVQTVRKKLGFKKEEDMFIVDNGFGLNCAVEIK